MPAKTSRGNKRRRRWFSLRALGLSCKLPPVPSPQAPFLPSQAVVRGCVRSLRSAHLPLSPSLLRQTALFYSAALRPVPRFTVFFDCCLRQVGLFVFLLKPSTLNSFPALDKNRGWPRPWLPSVACVLSACPRVPVAAKGPPGTQRTTQDCLSARMAMAQISKDSAGPANSRVYKLGPGNKRPPALRP